MPVPARIESVHQRLHRLPPVVGDVTVALVVAVLVGVNLLNPSEDGARDLDVLGWTLALAAAVPLVWRRRHPVGALWASVAASMTYHALDYPGGAPVPALWVALFSAAVTGHRRAAYGIGVVHALVATVYRWVVEGEAFWSPGVEAIVFVAVVVLGDAIHSRRQWLREARERLRRAEEAAESEAQRRVAEERLRIARELHDVLAHTVSVISVQAGVASETVGDNPEQAQAALNAIRSASREAMTELRTTIGVLRSGDLPAGVEAPLAPVPGVE
ncbi:MAG: histidine kinase dimerization/phosphoacceptor domain-containing protein, partial [Acidimicrobiales bacterium]